MTPEKDVAGLLPSSEGAVAWMRKWAFDNEAPYKVPNARGRLVLAGKFKLLPVTKAKLFPDDVALLAAPGAAIAAREQEAPELVVWFGSMPESNGKTNWTAMLYRKHGTFTDGFTIDRSEYHDRVRYSADCVRHLIGELKEAPDILAYDENLCSAPSREQAPVASGELTDEQLDAALPADVQRSARGHQKRWRAYARTVLALAAQKGTQ